MRTTVFMVIFAFQLLLSGKESQQSDSRRKLEKGAVFCILGTEEKTIKPFDFQLCTHVILYAELLCEKERCNFSNTPDIAKAAQWALSNLCNNVGILFWLDKTAKEYLFESRKRRSNTINEIDQFMKRENLTFLVFYETAYNTDDSSETEQVKFLLLVEEMAAKLHARGSHVGLDIGISDNSTELRYSFDIERMSSVVDWFYIAPGGTNFEGYMEPYTPLTNTSYGNARGNTKYWIEKALQIIRPDRLVVDFGPFYHTDTATEVAVEPGPGSAATETTSFEYNTAILCQKLITSPECRRYWDEQSSTPWAVCGDDFYTYDNARSLQLKANLARTYGITGLMLWTYYFTPSNICENGDPLKMLRALQIFRQPTSSTSLR